MATKNSGRLVKTGTGKIGVILNSDLPFQDKAGRLPVTIIENGKQKKLLCLPQNLIHFGYQD